MDTHRVFVRLCTDLVEVNEALCERRAVRAGGGGCAGVGSAEKRLRRRFARRRPAR
ncbi:MAG: hypothetical protein V2A77_03210 [Pseudomonadota bacterium]